MSEITNFSEKYRTMVLLICIDGARTLRDIFYSKVKRSDVASFFASQEVMAHFENLRRKDLITERQYIKLTSNPDPETFDITLLVILLTHLANTEPDKNLKDAIFQLRGIRNKLLCAPMAENRNCKYLYDKVQLALSDISNHVNHSHEIKRAKLERDNMDTKMVLNELIEWQEFDVKKFEEDLRDFKYGLERKANSSSEQSAAFPYTDKIKFQAYILTQELDYITEMGDAKQIQLKIGKDETGGLLMKFEQAMKDSKGSLDKMKDFAKSRDFVRFTSIEKECSQNNLEKLCLTHGRKDIKVIKLCESICNTIKSYSEFIVRVYAAFRKGSEREIVFVVTVMWDFALDRNDIPYKFIKRNYGEISTEGFDISNSKEEREHVMSTDETENLTSCLSKYSKNLMQAHKYLSIISGSSIRSKDYKPSSLCLIKETCIALYVYVKGYIPIEEDAFELEYGGVPVDIREGLFFPFGTAGEYHDDIKMGCKIMRPTYSSDRTLGGTLGGFIEHTRYGLCGITCAHAMLYPDELKECHEKGETSWPFIRSDDSVHQPEGPNNKIGRVIHAIYKEGSQYETGVEIALIQIEDRPPVSGEFPEVEQNGQRSSIQLSFDTGKTCGPSRFIGKEVCKFGSSTNFTMGKILKPTSTCVKMVDHEWNDLGYDVTLFNQIEVDLAIQGNFATHGDSGSLVFCKGLSGNLECLGMVEGGTLRNTCIVTPIQPILEALGVRCLKDFESVQIKNQISAIDDRLKEMERTVNNMSSNIQRNNNDDRLNTLDGKVDTILALLQARVNGNSS